MEQSHRGIIPLVPTLLDNIRVAVWKFRHVAGRTMGARGPAGCRPVRDRDKREERDGEREREIGCMNTRNRDSRE